MKKFFSFIFLVVLFALLQACGSSKETNQGISTSTQVINSGTGDGIPTPKGSNSSQPSGTKNCGANKWNVIPTKIYTLPSSPGLKVIP
jgi:hypothetical protein